MKRFVCVCMILVALFVITGCAGNSRPSAQSVVESAIDAVKAADSEKAANYWGNGFVESAQSESDAEIVKAIFSGVSYKIISSDEQDETAVVKAKISNKDISSILSDTMADAFSEILSSAFSGGEMSDAEQTEMMNKLFMEKLNSDDYGDVEQEVDISLSLVDGNWVIDKDQTEVYNALTGGLFSFAGNFSDFDNTTEPAEESMIWSDVHPGETIELATINICVTGCKEVQELTTEYLDPDVAQSGTKYVVFSVEIENITKDPIDISNDIPLVDNQGRSYNCYTDALWYYDETFAYTTLSPNIVKSGIFVYNVPSDSTDYYLSVAKDGTNKAFRLYAN